MKLDREKKRENQICREKIAKRKGRSKERERRKKSQRKKRRGIE